MCSSALGDGPGKVTSPSTFAQGQKLAVYRGRRAPRGFQRIGYYKQAEAHVSRCSRRGPIESMISLGNKLPNSLICLRQRLLIRQEYDAEDRKSTRLNSSHVAISYALFCLKKKSPDAIKIDHRSRQERPHHLQPLGLSHHA